MEVGSIAMGRWKYFFGASILAVALLIKAGAPIAVTHSNASVVQ